MKYFLFAVFSNYIFLAKKKMRIRQGLFFMLLPNSKKEVDVHWIGTDLAIAKNLPNAGLSPDIYIKPNIKNALRGIDMEIEAIKKLILKR